MPNATKRLQAYLKELATIRARAGEPFFLAVFQEKLFNWLARRTIQPQELKQVLAEIDLLFTSELSDFEEEIYDGYNAVLRAVNEHYGELPGDISREMDVMRRLERVNRLQLGDFNAETTKAIKQAVSDAITAGDTQAKLEADIASINEKAAHYARSIAHTQLMRYGRLGKWQKATAAGIEIYLYGGVLRETTRPFCRAHLGRRFHVNDIMEMRNGNLEPVWENCGGWRCIHDWEPDASATPEDTVQGQPIKVKEGSQTAVLFGDDADRKRYIYSIGLSGFKDNKAVREYVNKVAANEILDKELEHISHHYTGLDYDNLRAIIKRVRKTPDAVYYQHQQGGPRIVFVKDRHILYASPGKNRTMYQPAEEDFYKIQENLLSLMVNLTKLL